MPLPKIEITEDTLARLRVAREAIYPAVYAARDLAEAADTELQRYLMLKVVTLLEGPAAVNHATIRFHMAVQVAVADTLEKAAEKLRLAAEKFNALLPEAADLGQEADDLAYDLVGKDVMDALAGE